jgi:hypothetical protein
VAVNGEAIGSELHYRQHLHGHSCPLQNGKPTNHVFVRTPTYVVDAVDIVDLLRSIQANPDHHLIVLKDPCPVLIEQRAIRLHTQFHLGNRVEFLPSALAPSRESSPTS